MFLHEYFTLYTFFDCKFELVTYILLVNNPEKGIPMKPPYQEVKFAKKIVFWTIVHVPP